MLTVGAGGFRGVARALSAFFTAEVAEDAEALQLQSWWKSFRSCSPPRPLRALDTLGPCDNIQPIG